MQSIEKRTGDSRRMSAIKGMGKRNGIIGVVAEWQKTVWYPVLFAALCVVSS